MPDKVAMKLLREVVAGQDRYRSVSESREGQYATLKKYGWKQDNLHSDLFTHPSHKGHRIYMDVTAAAGFRPRWFHTGGGVHRMISGRLNAYLKQFHSEAGA